MRNIKTPYIFVYGTLMSGFRIKESIVFKKIAEFYSNAYCHGILYSTGAYPVLDHTHARYRVKGEIYIMNSPEKALVLLDKYEQAYTGEHEYVRRVIKVNTKNNTVMCYTYVNNLGSSHLFRLKKGEYLPAKRKKFSLHMQP